MALPAIGQATWQEEIEEVASQFRGALISVYDPSAPGLTAVISRRPARVQQVRTPSIAHDSGQQIVKRPFLFEIELRTTDPLIRKGYIIRIHTCDRDPTLRHYGFTVSDAVNSSEAALRTINTVTELAVLEVIP